MQAQKHCNGGCVNGPKKEGADLCNNTSSHCMALREVKVCILGDAGVGKSSIVQRFVTDTYHDSIPATIGASYLGKTLQVGTMSYKYQIWDTAGQEKYRGLAPMYYRNAAAAVIVYDITCQKSFERVKDWVQELRQYGPDSICIAIAGNKSDLEDVREVSRETGLSYASEINAIFDETSAKMASNILNLFIEISKHLPEEVHNRETGNIKPSTFDSKSGRGCCK